MQFWVVAGFSFRAVDKQQAGMNARTMFPVVDTQNWPEIFLVDFLARRRQSMIRWTTAGEIG